jgi:hypothetical protein
MEGVSIRERGEQRISPQFGGPLLFVGGKTSGWLLLDPQIE